MKILDAGYVYELDTTGKRVEFNKYTPEGTLVQEGSTNEEVLGILIDRLKFLEDKKSCLENKQALYHMQRAMDAFKHRAVRMHAESKKCVS